MFGTPLQRTELYCLTQTLKDTKSSSLLFPASLAEVRCSWSLALHHPPLQFLDQAAWLLFQQWSQHLQSPFLLEPKPTLLHSIKLFHLPLADVHKLMQLQLSELPLQPLHFDRSVIYSIRNVFQSVSMYDLQSASPLIEHHPVTYCSYHILQDPITSLIQDVHMLYRLLLHVFTRTVHMQYTFKRYNMFVQLFS